VRAESAQSWHPGADGVAASLGQGHKDNVYTVSYSKDGKRFSSGGADKAVIIWKANGEGILKYSHNDTIQARARTHQTHGAPSSMMSPCAVRGGPNDPAAERHCCHAQCVEYNPVTLELASATGSDFGIWSPDQKSVSKHKIAARATSVSWTSDGQLLAIGQFDGCVSVRQKDGVEKVLIRRAGGSPVWSVHFNPATEEGDDVLSVGCWDGTLSFFSLQPKQIGKDRTLGYDPCCARYFNNGEYLVMGGSDKKVPARPLSTSHECKTFSGCVYSI
jgi:intraflagellar transport protein 122